MGRKYKNPRKKSPKVPKEILGLCQHVIRGATFGPNCEDPVEEAGTCDKPAYDRHDNGRVYCRKHIKVHIGGEIEEYGEDEPACEYDSPAEVDFVVNVDVDESDEEYNQ